MDLRRTNPCGTCGGSGRVKAVTTDDGRPSCLMTTCLGCLGTGTDELVKMIERRRSQQEEATS